MKKVLLTAAIACAAFGANAQIILANQTTPRKWDNASFQVSLTMVDMIDIEPEGNSASNTFDSWTELNGAQVLTEAAAFGGGQNIEFGVSSSRAFFVAVQGQPNFSGPETMPIGAGGANLQLQIVSTTNAVYPATADLQTPNGMNTWLNVPGGTDISAFVAANNTSVEYPYGAGGLTPDLHLVEDMGTSAGGNNYQFAIQLRANPGYGWEEGTYTNTLRFIAAHD